MSNTAVLWTFFALLGLTVVVLGVALALAHKHHVRGHIGAIGVFLVLLLVTLYFAELLGTRYDFAETPQRVHLFFAFSAAGSLLVPLVTGVQHWRGRMSRGAHVIAARVFLALTVGAIGTGFWMLSTATSPTG